MVEFKHILSIYGPDIQCPKCGGTIESQKGDKIKTGNVEKTVTKLVCVDCGHSQELEVIRVVFPASVTCKENEDIVVEWDECGNVGARSEPRNE